VKNVDKNLVYSYIGFVIDVVAVVVVAEILFDNSDYKCAVAVVVAVVEDGDGFVAVVAVGNVVGE
jgi:hypothetical protein